MTYSGGQWITTGSDGALTLRHRVPQVDDIRTASAPLPAYCLTTTAAPVTATTVIFRPSGKCTNLMTLDNLTNSDPNVLALAPSAVAASCRATAPGLFCILGNAATVRVDFVGEDNSRSVLADSATKVATLRELLAAASHFHPGVYAKSLVLLPTALKNCIGQRCDLLADGEPQRLLLHASQQLLQPIWLQRQLQARHRPATFHSSGSVAFQARLSIMYEGGYSATARSTAALTAVRWPAYTAGATLFYVVDASSVVITGSPTRLLRQLKSWGGSFMRPGTSMSTADLLSETGGEKDKSQQLPRADNARRRGGSVTQKPRRAAVSPMPVETRMMAAVAAPSPNSKEVGSVAKSRLAVRQAPVESRRPAGDAENQNTRQARQRSQAFSHVVAGPTFAWGVGLRHLTQDNSQTENSE
uniref:Uncharacterized protein n=1 Tax=Macrostomum lignano TaxID=282301 RepID=A0A1I8FEW8_9PLAT